MIPKQGLKKSPDALDLFSDADLFTALLERRLIKFVGSRELPREELEQLKRGLPRMSVSVRCRSMSECCTSRWIAIAAMRLLRRKVEG